jgi:hypothetical protein
LLQAGGRGRGRRLLYFFRTPPAVRVGRAPIDETAIRLLEQHNPDVEFDWTRILKTPPTTEPPGRRESRDSRDWDQRGRREARAPQRPRSGGAPGPEPAVERVDELAPERADQVDRHADRAADVGPSEDYAPEGERATEYTDRMDPATAGDAGEEDARSPGVAAGPLHESTEAADAFEEPAAPVDLATEVRPEDEGSASYARLGAEGLVRLRARYAEVMARIAERPLEAEAREELKLRAERLNPDAWVTADEVSAALEQYESVFEGLRGIVGRHPRRRRRSRR